MATTTQETDQAARAVNLYVERIGESDTARLREAFHPDAHMWGSMDAPRAA